MRRLVFSLPFIALAVAMPAEAQDVQDFKLPPGATPTPESRAQGPVDADAPTVSRPRVIPTARPAPIILPSPSAVPTPLQTGAAAAAPALSPRRPSVPSSEGSAAPRLVETSIAETLPTSPQPEASPEPLPPVVPSPVPSSVATADGGGSFWPWLAAGGLVLLAGLAGFIWLARRRRSAAPAPIERPDLAADAPTSVGTLVLAVEALRFDRSLMNATLGYRITIRNPGTGPLGDLVVEADLVSASRDMPTESQVASPDLPLAQQHTAERLGPGQSQRFEGQVRLPLAEASAIRQGNVGLLVPLLRVRAHAAGAEPVVTTLVVGAAQGPASRPQPFRLDEGPRSYLTLAQRVLDAVPARA